MARKNATRITTYHKNGSTKRFDSILPLTRHSSHKRYALKMTLISCFFSTYRLKQTIKMHAKMHRDSVSGILFQTHMFEWDKSNIIVLRHQFIVSDHRHPERQCIPKIDRGHIKVPWKKIELPKRLTFVDRIHKHKKYAHRHEHINNLLLGWDFFLFLSNSLFLVYSSFEHFTYRVQSMAIIALITF